MLSCNSKFFFSTTQMSFTFCPEIQNKCVSVQQVNFLKSFLKEAREPHPIWWSLNRAEVHAGPELRQRQHF